MADYVVTLTGKDNLSKTIKSVKQELDSVGSAATKMDKIAAKFDKIQNSAAPLKRQLKDTSVLLSQMKFDGNFNAGQFLEMAKAAGKAKDAIGDTQQIIKAFADDNFALNAVVQGVQGIAAAGSVATGTMALFGVQSEEATEAIRKVQGALAILNGLQTIANVLNKDSYVSIARKVIALKAEAVATDKATVAQTRLNLAVLANPYVAAAAAIAALAAAIYVYTRNSDDATRAQEELQKSAENFKQAQDRENATLAESVTKFKSLQSQWNSLAGDLNGKKKFITDNKTEFENLGIKVNNVTDAEAVFGRNANAIIAAMRARARAAAAYATMVDNLKDQYAKLGEVERKIKNGESFTESDLKDIGILNPDAMAGLREDLTLKSFFGGEKSYTVFGKNAADLIMDAATVRAEQRADELNKTLEKEAEKALKIANETPFYSTSGKGGNKPTKPTKSTSKGGGKSTTTEKEKEELGVLGKLNKELKEKQSLLDAENTSLAKQQQLLEEIADLQAKIKRIQTARSNAVDGTLSGALAPQKLTIQPEIDTKKLEESLPKLETAYDIALRKQEEFKRKTEEFSDVASALGSNFSALGNIFKETGDNATAGMMQLVSITMQGVSQVIPQIMALIGAKEGEALASGTASAAALPFPANIAAIAGVTATILATFASILATTKRFESGGIIGGTSYSGDKLLARVNSGEMVLNKRQQTNLFNAINSGNIGGGTVSTVNFKLRGADIYGSMKNYQAIKSKTGLKGI